MVDNWLNNSNTQPKDFNSFILSYKNKIDTNNDGQISAEELKVFEKENPDIDTSIFAAELAIYMSDSSTGDTVEFTQSAEKTTTTEGSSYINVENLKGVDFNSFSQMSTAKNNDETSEGFWGSLSKFALDKLFNLIDTGKDGVLSEDELVSLSSQDGDNQTLSIQDLQQLLDSLNNETLEETQVVATQETAPTKKSGGSRRSGKDSSSSNSDVPTVDTKTQLSNNYNSATTNFSAAKSKYENALDGSIADSEVNSKKEAMDSAYDAWQSELAKQDLSLSQNIDVAQKDVENTNNQISQNEKEIFNNEVNLSNCTTAYETAQAFTNKLKGKQSQLKSARSGLDASNEADAKKIEMYDNQLSKIESEINNAIRAEENAKKKKEEAQKALDDSIATKKTLNETLTQQQSVLSDYMLDAGNLASNNPALAQLQKDYEDKKTEYETALKEYKENLKTDALSKQDKVASTQKALSEYENDKKVAEYDKSLIGYDTDFASLINKYLLQGASDGSKSDCGGAVRRAMNKALSEMYGPNVAAIFKEGYGVIGADWDNQYLVDSPFFTDITDMYSASEIETMLQKGELLGAVINYEQYSGGKSGHVEGVTTEGLTSDYTRGHDYFRSTSSLGKAAYHIYIPREASQEEIDEYIRLMQSRKANYDSPIL